MHYKNKKSDPLLYYVFYDGGSVEGDGISARELWEDNHGG